jgi:hypothetical protein
MLFKSTFPCATQHGTRIFLLFVSLFFFVESSRAQLAGAHLLGDAGLASGSQSEPSISPLLIITNYHSKTFVNADKTDRSLPTLNYGSIIAGAAWVTNFKILGANLGGSALLSMANAKTEGSGISSKTPFALSDSYVQPFQLGWSTDRADFTFDYSLSIPTGKYELNGAENTGLGMWTHEFSAGSTLYLNEDQDWSVSALMAYDINSKKRNTGDNRIVVGNIITVEGGLGKSWEIPQKKKGETWAVNAGMVYYMQFKVTKDQLEIPEIGNVPILLNNKDHILAAGVQADVYVPVIKTTIMVNWLQEFDAQNRLRGNSLLITFIPFAKALHPKNQPEEKTELSPHG